MEEEVFCEFWLLRWSGEGGVGLEVGSGTDYLVAEGSPKGYIRHCVCVWMNHT